MQDLKELQLIKRYIEEKSGIVFDETNGHLLESQLMRLQKKLKLERIEDFYTQLCIYRDNMLLQHLIDAITTNETFWFRDRAIWVILEQRLLPYLINKKREHPSRRIRIWSAACSYGQEPYSLVMFIVKYLKQHCISDITIFDFDIIATDISSFALEIARNGIYDSFSVSRGLSEIDKQLFFAPCGEQWQIIDEIRQAVTFQHFNLMEKYFAFDNFDIVLCKNVMIYFSEETKRELYAKIYNVLVDDGILFVGSSELLDEQRQLFVREQHFDGVYYLKKLK